MPYIPHTKKDEEEMLREIGIDNVNDFFRDIPVSKTPFTIPKGLSEQEALDLLKNLSEKNILPKINFLGSGAYNHYIPAVIPYLLSRGEFLTAYTPYQPEISQGMLQSIFEYQTLICELTAMEAANASMYDGSTATAEACIMAANITGKNKILVSEAVHPEYRQVMQTYCAAKGLVFETIKYNEDGKTSFDDLKNVLDDNTAGIFIQSPNFFGVIEDIAFLAEFAHNKNSLLIQIICEALSLGLLKPPGQTNADIAVGEAQSFGIQVSYGGPFCGFLATKMKHVRSLPGRLVGETTDADGSRAFVLTLQAREQHIRREKASSNICTNSALMALASTIYLAVLGKNLKKLAELNYKKANAGLKMLLQNRKIKQKFQSSFFNEFVVEIENLDEIYEKCLKENIIPGVKLGKWHKNLQNCLLMCVTELNKKEEINAFLNICS